MAATRLAPATRRRYISALVLFVCAATLGPVASIRAEDAAKPGPAAAGWTVNCAGAAGQAELVCTLVQTLVVKENGQRVLTAVLARRDGGLVLSLGLPHGLDLVKGVDLSVDEGERTGYPIVTADQKGSYAMIAVGDALLGAMKQGKLLNVAVSAYGGEEIILRLSLSGLTAGLAKL
ncbi:MAG: invasion associated locus B family protein [Rhizobiaceae bacterium]|nr:invasion associated locus B family protein [Rhizobiaceae bacterium]